MWLTSWLLLGSFFTVELATVTCMMMKTGSYTRLSGILSGSDIRAFTTRDKIACTAVCLKYNCTTVVYDANQRDNCFLLTAGNATTVNNSLPSSGKAYVAVSIGAGSYCSGLPPPGTDGIYRNATNSSQVLSGTKVGYYCRKWTAFHSQDLVNYGYTVSGQATDAERFGTVFITCQPTGIWTLLPRCSGFADCKKTTRGKEYTGKKNVTATGEACLPWSQQTNDNATLLRDNNSYPHDGSMFGAQNYCRNPLNVTIGPFCVVNNISHPRQSCGIPICEDTRPFECVWTLRGTEFIGTSFNKTRSGYGCQAWTVDTPNLRGKMYAGQLQDDNIEHNYCRQPGILDTYPWCYALTGVTWERCNMPYCPGYP